jgi:hypothetical protein
MACEPRHLAAPPRLVRCGADGTASYHPSWAGGDHHGEAVQARGSRLVEFGSRCRARQNHPHRTSPTKFKGYTVHASSDEPQYEMKSDTMDHIAMHKGSALTKLRT